MTELENMPVIVQVTVKGVVVVAANEKLYVLGELIRLTETLLPDWSVQLMTLGGWNPVGKFSFRVICCAGWLGGLVTVMT
jgi:hypothetical protein